MKTSTAKSVLNSDEVERVEAALDALLTEMLRQDDLRKGDGDGKLVTIRASDMVLLTRRQGQINAVLRHPVRAACKIAIRMLGERLNELGLSISQMQDVANRVSAGKRFPKRINIIDKAWDGVGHWVA